jgi:hypothetical protein
MPNDPFVDVAALRSLGPVRYLDARDQAAFDAGHAPGAVRVPLKEWDAAAKMAQVPAARNIGRNAQVSTAGCRERRTQPFVQFQMDDLPNADFAIERRAGEPYSSNRFFCTAPMRTEAHVRVLGLIETAMRD